MSGLQGGDLLFCFFFFFCSEFCSFFFSFEIPPPFLLATDGALQMASLPIFLTPPFSLFSTLFFSQWLPSGSVDVHNKIPLVPHHNCLDQCFTSAQMDRRAIAWGLVSVLVFSVLISLLDSFCFLGADGTFTTVAFPSR